MGAVDGVVFANENDGEVVFGALIPLCQEMFQEFGRPKQDAGAVQAEPTVNLRL